MSGEQLAQLSGIVLSLVFSYVPGVSTWYEALSPVVKRVVMLVLLVVVSFGVFGLSCAGVIANVTCDIDGAKILAFAFINALLANQATFLISPRKAR